MEAEVGETEHTSARCTSRARAIAGYVILCWWENRRAAIVTLVEMRTKKQTRGLTSRSKDKAYWMCDIASDASSPRKSKEMGC